VNEPSLSKEEEEKKEATVQNSYRTALKSTTIIGGASVVTILCSIIRGKFAAVLLQTEGVGLMGMYNAITTTLATAASIGMNNSGVRQIAEAAGAHAEEVVARTGLALRRLCLLLGLGGSALLVLLAWPISWWSFGNAEHVTSLALLAPVVFCTVVFGGQTALLQGLRRIGDVARLNVWGAVAGTALGVPFLFWWLERGIVPLLLLVAVTAALASWWYARRVRLDSVSLSWRETWVIARQLLNLGTAFMVSALLGSLVAWLTRTIVWRQLGEDPAGQYQAAWALSGMYVGFILQAMSTDYYPRLTAAANDRSALNRLVNEQVEVSFLLAVPGIIATLALAPVILHVFFSREFYPAADVLRWQMLGVLLRVASWPLGFVILARNNSRVFLWTEVAMNGVHITFVWLGCRWFGLAGSGMAFFGVYLLHWVLMIFVVRRMTHFRLSRVNILQLAWMFPAVGVTFAACELLPSAWAAGSGSVLTLLTGFLSLRALATLLPNSRWSRLARRLMPWLR
jgi:PST family polysaccharide transporter